MRPSTAWSLLAISMFGCGSDPIVPRDNENSGGDGNEAGAAGHAGVHAGTGGDVTNGDAGASAESGATGSGHAGSPNGEGGDAGSPSLPVIGYRLAGIAYGTFPGGEGGAAGEGSGGSSGDGASNEAGAGGAPIELPHIDRAECNFYLDFVDVIEDDTGGFEAFAIGEVFRNVYAGDQRWEFSAFVGGPASFSVNDDGSAELRAFGDQTGAKPFWREIEVLYGTRNANGTSGGPWSCASLELFEPGFPDTEGTATGTWLLVPVN